MVLAREVGLGTGHPQGPNLFTFHTMPLRRRPATYVDTPRGIFTDAGNWFRTREAWVADYAQGVIERKSLGHLLADAEIWMRSPQTLALWALLPMVYFMPPVWALVSCISVFATWKLVGPAMVSRTAMPILRIMDSVLVQASAFVVALSVAAAQSRFAIVGTCLGAFIALRWGLPEIVLRPVLRPVLRRWYRLPASDHVLRAFIIRSALHYGVTLTDFAAIERNIVQGLEKK